jgi:type II secretory pathway predicted ATPase ExeA
MDTPANLWFYFDGQRPNLLGPASPARQAAACLSAAGRGGIMGATVVRQQADRAMNDRPRKHFNTAGPCKPEMHYMLPPERRLGDLEPLIADGKYFVVHAPRQTGKTTAFQALCRRLNEGGRYVALYVNVENAQVAGGDLATGMPLILGAIRRRAEELLAPELRPAISDPPPEPGEALNEVLSAWTLACPRPTVLFIDEIDALQDETLISVLRQLRSGYDTRPKRFPQCVALIGLRDVRDYRARVRPDSNSLGTASPFNVKAESLTLRNFTRAEVEELYAQHTEATGQQFAHGALDLAFGLTQGQPWLVNALAAQAVGVVVPDRQQQVEVEHVRQAKEILVERRDCHLDSLVDKLREPRVKRIIEKILVGDAPPMDVLNDDLVYVRDLGLISTQGTMAIANPIYAEVIPRTLSWVMQVSIHQETAWYVRDDGSLDVPALLRAFQKFFRRHSEAWLSRFEFQEAGPHLMLMAFLQRVVNAGGTIEREFAVGSGRADVVVRWREDVHAIELKVRYDEATESEGVEQLGRYLERLGLAEGFLVIFDRRQDVGWDEKLCERVAEHAEKRIHVFGM